MPLRNLIHEAPARLGAARLWRKVHRTSVPVIILHGILPDADSSPFNSTGKFISADRLKRFMERIGRLFRVISAEDFVASMASGARVENAMVITFDDGYANNYEFGLPLLEKMGLPFTVFVTTGFLDSGRVLWNDLLEFAVFSTKRKVIPARALPHDIGIADHAERVAAIAAIKDHLKRKPLEEAASQVDALCEDLDADRGSARLADVRFMSRDQILRMSQSGVAIGGHGVTHSILSRESADRARAEVVDSKAALEAITGKPVVIFAYPNGQREDFSAAVKADLIEAGYRAAFTTIHGLHRPGDDLYEIKRISLDNRWSYLEFETRVSGVVKALRR